MLKGRGEQRKVTKPVMARSSAALELNAEQLEALAEGGERALTALLKKMVKEEGSLMAAQMLRGDPTEQMRRIYAWYRGEFPFDAPKRRQKPKVGESKSSDYTKASPPPRRDDASHEGMRDEQDLNAFAAKLGYTFEEAAATLTAAKKTAPATAKPRLKWETDARPDEDPAHFAHRAGYQHRGLIHAEDRALSIKLANWLRTHEWPKGVAYIPTKTDWNTEQLAELGRPPKPAKRPRIGSAEGRLYEVARVRRQRHPAL
jgi:hypothetical protein